MSTALLISVLADVPNPAPVDPTKGAQAITNLFAYAKWGVLAGLGLAALTGVGFMGWGKLSDRPDAAHKGKVTVLWCIAGALGAAVIIPMINSVFATAS
ncbi:hypothetical protein [Actinoplanes regularis]|uniref:TrbC/VIRB2 family protein n=1 Tax=Actinoplanes regularis TaxID=52697 RepID=A0A238XID1_9ACTN|nr:hypothetical protein [Actinoplanes regularis]GIE86827.1 hypothetical protein Are01nite_33070 [Actinoplanes regularis]SNR58233.1 hypothetical protein SAMN06264365_103453 [Actinoplanes regularis]